MRFGSSLALSLAFVAAVAAQSAAQKSDNMKSDGFTWGAAPPILPAGAKLAVLSGDPSKPALFTIRLELPDGYRIAPHWHPTDEHVTVIQGTFLVGMGDVMKPAETTKLSAGGFVTAGANQHHYAIARGKTIVQVHAMGPFALTYVNPADDPTRTSAKKH